MALLRNAFNMAKSSIRYLSSQKRKQWSDPHYRNLWLLTGLSYGYTAVSHYVLISQIEDLKKNLEKDGEELLD